MEFIVKKTIVLVLALSAVLGACSVNALAQQSCKARFDAAWYSIWNGDLIPPIPPGASNCQTNGPWAVVCDMQSYQCPPHVDNVCPTCPKAGHPIALSTGNTYIEQPDIRVPGLSRGLTLVRVWNSRTGYAVGLFGRGWRSTYEESIFVDSENYIDYSRGDDSIWSFGFYGMDPAGTGDSVFWTAAPANGGASLQSTILRVPAKSYWTLTFKDGEKRVFDMALQRLTAIVDRNGNIQLDHLRVKKIQELIPTQETIDKATNAIVKSYTEIKEQYQAMEEDKTKWSEIGPQTVVGIKTHKEWSLELESNYLIFITKYSKYWDKTEGWYCSYCDFYKICKNMIW